MKSPPVIRKIIKPPPHEAPHEVKARARDIWHHQATLEQVREEGEAAARQNEQLAAGVVEEDGDELRAKSGDERTCPINRSLTQPSAPAPPSATVVGTVSASSNAPVPLAPPQASAPVVGIAFGAQALPGSTVPSPSAAANSSADVREPSPADIRERLAEAPPCPSVAPDSFAGPLAVDVPYMMVRIQNASSFIFYTQQVLADIETYLGIASDDERTEMEELMVQIVQKLNISHHCKALAEFAVHTNDSWQELATFAGSLCSLTQLRAPSHNDAKERTRGTNTAGSTRLFRVLLQVHHFLDMFDVDTSVFETLRRGYDATEARAPVAVPLGLSSWNSCCS